MSPIETVLSEVLARLVLDEGAVLPALPTFSSANFLFGHKHLSTTRKSPKIVVVPEGGPLSTELVRPGGNPRSLVVRTPVLRFFCFGKTLIQTEAILHNAVRAVRNTQHNSMRLLNEEWIENAWDRESELVTFTVSIQFPVYDLSVPTYVPEGESHNTEWNGSETLTC
jgi:hypothetical protein